MINYKDLKYFSLVLAGIVLLSLGCEKDKNAESGFMNLHFDHSVDGDVLELEKLKYLSPVGHPYSVVRLKYYISNIALVKMDGSKMPFEQIHYVDAEDANSRSLELGEVPAGEYTGLSFTFGLDEATNIDSGLPNTQANLNMEWPIPGDQGYHYMKFEGRYDSLGSGVINNFNIHTGATMGNQNFVEVNLPLDQNMNVDGNNWQIDLDMDLNEWLQNPNSFDFAEFGPMIMMNQNAQRLIKENGSTVFSIKAVNQN